MKNRFSVVPSVKMSEFDGNLVIQTVKCRIPQFKEGFGLIYRETRSLQRLKTKKRDNLSTLSRFVPGVGIEPTLQRNTSLSRARLPVPPSGHFFGTANLHLFKTNR